MDANEIIEGNKLIANFMAGYSTKSNHNFYHESWNELMPVVEKIDLMGFDVQISRISIKISRILENENPIISLVCGDVSQKLDLCFLACVEFIKWYNQNKEL